MTAPGLDIEAFGQRLRLLAARAIYWQEAGALILADAHLGKDAAFRDAGVPVPAGSIAADVRRLAAAADLTGCRRVWILGDLLHARRGRDRKSLEPFLRWRRSRTDLEILLVRGNHDLAAGDPPEEWDIRCEAPPYDAGAFWLCHEPLDCVGPSIAGHLHPAVRLPDRDGSSLRLPCFHWAASAQRWTLPAFGSFTGGAAVQTEAGDRLFAIASRAGAPEGAPEGAVIEVPPEIRRRRGGATPALARRARGAGSSSEAP